MKESKAQKSGRLFTHSALLHTLGHHDDVVDVLFPGHFPEVILGARKRSLSSDVFSSEAVALQWIYNMESQKQWASSEL